MSSCQDDCNWLLKDLSDKVVYGKCKLDHVIYLLNTLQWLLITHRTKFKFFTLSYKALCSSPCCTSDLISYYFPFCLPCFFCPFLKYIIHASASESLLFFFLSGTLFPRSLHGWPFFPIHITVHTSPSQTALPWLCIRKHDPRLPCLISLCFIFFLTTFNCGRNSQFIYFLVFCLLSLWIWAP